VCHRRLQLSLRRIVAEPVRRPPPAACRPTGRSSFEGAASVAGSARSPAAAAFRADHVASVVPRRAGAARKPRPRTCTPQPGWLAPPRPRKLRRRMADVYALSPARLMVRGRVRPRPPSPRSRVGPRPTGPQEPARVPTSLSRSSHTSDRATARTERRGDMQRVDAGVC